MRGGDEAGNLGDLEGGCLEEVLETERGQGNFTWYLGTTRGSLGKREYFGVTQGDLRYKRLFAEKLV